MTFALTCCLALAAYAAPISARQEDGSDPWFEQFYRSLRDLEPDPERSVPVTGLTLTRDAGIFHLEEGRIHALRPVDGRTPGVVFSGRGRFEMAAPEAVEQAQLVRRFGTDRVEKPFKAAVFLFTDFTLAELTQSLELTPAPVDSDAEREVREAREYFTDGDGWVSRTIALPLANAGPGFFYAHFSQDRGDPLVFVVDPHAFEEVSLARKRDRVKRREVVAQFHRAADYATGRSVPQEGLDLIGIADYEIETEIEGDLDVIGRATMSVQRRMGMYRWIPFTLFSELEVDSIRWGDGTPAPYYRPEDSSDLWVDFDGAPEGAAELTFHYRGDMMDRLPQGLWIQLGSHTSWYPVYEFGREAPYELTFHAPDDLVVTTVGRQTSSQTAGDVVTTTWETGPVRMLTFNVGEFDRFEADPPTDGDPGLTVLVNESAHRRLGAMAAERGYFLLEQRDMAEMVAIDLRNGFTFFNEVFGPTTVKDFVATEIPYSHGEAYPGLVMLAWNTFQWTTEAGFDEMFRAHEVAHQWWGIGVRPATYRDWWIAEGFSEFAGWWYAARARGSVDMYFKRLRETRDVILKRRGESEPIALGQRVGTSEHPEDYQATIYLKGAWVLHMLRSMLTDYDTGSDDAFKQIMQRFYATHLGGVATTGSFQASVEEVLGADMSWFFQQWVYGSDIPTYTFSHRYDPHPDGGVKTTVRVRQEKVPEDFQMIVPIHLDFGDDGVATVRVRVSGPLTEVELPRLPREPDAIEFNAFESVLAEVKTEGWRN